MNRIRVEQREEHNGYNREPLSLDTHYNVFLQLITANDLSRTVPLNLLGSYISLIYEQKLATLQHNSFVSGEISRSNVTS